MRATLQETQQVEGMSEQGLETAVCVLGASYTTGNRGVSALASGTVNAVKNTWPAGSVFLLDYGRFPLTRDVQHHNGTTTVELINIRFSWRVWHRNNVARLIVAALIMRLAPVGMVHRIAIDAHPVLRRLKDMNVFVALGGGDSFADIYGLGRLLYIALPQILVLLLDKPLVQLPQTLGPFKGLFAKTLAGWILRRSVKVYSRDTDSAAMARSLMGERQHRVEFSYDMAFVLEPVRPHRGEPGWFSRSPEPIVGINLSGLLHLGGYTGDNMFGLNVDYRRMLGETLKLFIEELNCRVALIPHAYKPGDQLESDTIACEAAMAEWSPRYGDRLFYVEGDYNEGEIKFLIGRCDFFIGARMHACIAALSQGVPAVGLAYSGKFLGVWRSIGLERLVLDLRELDIPAVISGLREHFCGRAQWRSVLQRTMPGIRATVLTLFSRTLTDGAVR
jgi:colanic acid/amylovoran biosynthesis protein